MYLRLLSLFTEFPDAKKSAKHSARRPTTRRRDTRRKRHAQLEQLERREVFATLIDAYQVTFQDPDGDQAQIVFSKPILNAANVNSIVKFNVGSVNGNNNFKQRLESIDLTKVSGAAGTDVTVRAVDQIPSHQVDLGRLQAGGVRLGTVSVSGDLRSIYVGDANSVSKGLISLDVGSFGKQANPELSTIFGGLGSLVIRGNLEKANLSILGDLDQLYMSGSIVGGSQSNSGRLAITQNLKDAWIHGDIIGASGANSGSLYVGDTITSLHMTGSLKGGSGLRSGSIQGKNLGCALADIIGGTGQESGSIHAKGDISGVSLSGSIYGGHGLQSGSILSDHNIVSGVYVSHEIYGGMGTDSGEILAVENMGQVFVAGSIIGNAGLRSGRVQAIGNLEGVTVKDLIGGDGYYSASISSAKSLPKVTVLRDIIGGKGEHSGSIFSSGNVENVVVNGSIKGGSGAGSGQLMTFGSIAAVRVDGSLIGGSGHASGSISIKGGCSTFILHGTVSGTSGLHSGEILVGGDFNHAEIGGFNGGSASYSGRIEVGGNVNEMIIGGDVKGGNNLSLTQPLVETGSILARSINQLYIGGSIIAGTTYGLSQSKNNGTVRVADNLNSLYLEGSMLGNQTQRVTFTARGSSSPNDASDRAFGYLHIRGNVQFTQILAGVNQAGSLVNADAQIGTVLTVGTWYNSDLATGVGAGQDGRYGTADDVKPKSNAVKDNVNILSTIDNFFAGYVVGPRGSLGRSAIVAEHIKLVSAPGNVSLNAGGNNDFAVVPKSNLIIREWR